MKRESKTPYALLGILSQCEMSGYEIKKYTEETLGFFWNESFGQIYPTLKSLEKKKLVTSHEVNSRDSNKLKIVYKITKQGIAELKKWLEGQTSKSTIRNEFLLKLFFARTMSPEKLLEMIRDEEVSAEQELLIYKAIQINLQSNHSKNPDSKYWLFTLDYGMECAKMTLKWLSKIKKNL